MELNEALYRGLLEAAPDAIVGVTPDGAIALVNAQTEVRFGYGRDELIGRPFEMLVPGVSRHIALHLVDEGDGSKPTRPAPRSRSASMPRTRPIAAGLELAGRRKDGSEFPAEISLSAIETEDGLLVSAAIRDGTERKQAAIISSSSDAIVSNTTNGLITTWNPGAETLYGYSPARILGHDVRELIPGGHLDAEEMLLAQVAAGERVPEYETVRLRANGTEVHVAQTLSPILDAGGAVVGISTISRDMTERRRAHNERQALEDRLHQSERLESLGQLAGGIAHDFNNLLSVILNYASFVAEEVTDNEAVRDDVEEIRAAAERAARLTHQLLIFGRRETNQPETFDLDGVVADVQNLLSRTIGEEIELVVQPSLIPPIINADRGQIEQILVNLAVNARDAMPRGGRLTIATTTVVLGEDDAILHAGMLPGRYIQLVVSDTGTGMDEETIDHAFEPFFSTKPKGEGTGLGLATVYGIVVEAAGSITIKSERDLGTTVLVCLPPAAAADLGEGSAGGQPTSPGRDGAGETILLVEDEDAIRRVTTRILQRHGYAVIQATNGTAALEIASQEHFDLLLTDVVMPNMSGRELAERIGAKHPGMPTVFMSGYSSGLLGQQRALDPGLALIQKPFSEQALISRINDVLSAHS